MREIVLPPAHNKRADEMWSIIELGGVEFDDKSVLDLGCGYGDMLWRAWRAGAANVMGLDSGRSVCRFGQRIIERNGWDEYVCIGVLDINDLRNIMARDIVMCFSVLPYLDDPDATLHWIREHSSVALLEVQYAGDGPGFARIHNDDDMRQWLLDVGWQRVESLGRTHTKIRDAWRTIWKCES